MKVVNIYLSYSNRDYLIKDRLLNPLKILESQGITKIFTSKHTPENDKTFLQSLSNSKIILLLISTNYISDDFIIKNEHPIIFGTKHTNDKLVFSILLDSCSWTMFPNFVKTQFLNDVRKPLLNNPNQEIEISSISNKIINLTKAIINKISKIKDEEIRVAPTNKLEQSTELAKSEIFISHCNYDNDFVELLKIKLEQKGISVWIDFDRLEPGYNWKLEIDKAIKRAKTIIVIMTPEARESEYVTYEWSFAIGCGKRIIPILLRETSLHPKLASIQYLNFTNFNSRPWNKLIENVKIHKPKIKILKK